MLIDLIDRLSARGHTNFDLKDLQEMGHSSLPAIRAALHRLQLKGKVVSPRRGFFSIVPPAYRSLGCVPPDQFIPDLMNYLNSPYYVGLLSAAEYYGAAHQRPQVFQVVTDEAKRPIKCGRVAVEFVFKKKVETVPTRRMNTRVGVIEVSTPEVTAFDLVGYVRHCGGLNNVATVLSELHGTVDASRLAETAKLVPVVWAQRVGYLIDLVGGQEKTADLAAYVKAKNPVRMPLSPSRSIKGAKLDGRWRVFVNAGVEADI